MARRRTEAGRHRLDDFDLREHLAFIAGWSPRGPHANPWRWTTWAQYLDDFRAVRDAMHAAYRSGARATWPPLFADVALAWVERHGHDEDGLTTACAYGEFSRHRA